MSRRETDHWSSHLRQAEREDIAFLADAGVSFEEACRRVGVTPETFDRRNHRATQRAAAEQGGAA